eukprot:1285500-Pyramimonas_sp.AAC.1
MCGQAASTDRGGGPPRPHPSGHRRWVRTSLTCQGPTQAAEGGQRGGPQRVDGALEQRASASRVPGGIRPTFEGRGRPAAGRGTSEVISECDPGGRRGAGPPRPRQASSDGPPLARESRSADHGERA